MKQLLLSVLITAALLFGGKTTCIAQTATAPSGSGTVGDPYQIATLSNLYWVAVQTNSGNTFSGKYLIQTANIDASSTSTWFSGQGWMPIGYDTDGAFNTYYPFSGNYNGQNHTISNLYMNRSAFWCGGLFGIAFGASISNIGLSNVSLTVSIGSPANQWLGALIGYAYQSTVIDNCYATGNISGDNNAGGLIGTLDGAGGSNSLSKSFFNGTVSGNYGAGGLCSDVSADNSISKCYSAGSVTCTTYYTGGLIGNCGGTVSNCYSTSTVNGGQYSGGLIGAGYNTATLSYCYAAGGVSGTSGVGGLIGYNFTAPSVTNCFWNTQTTGQSSSGGGGTGKTTAEMQTTSTYSGWDFTTIWNRIDTKNNKYPYLAWQVLPSTATVTTTAISTYNATSATMGGNVTADGGATVTERGVVYSLASANTNPQIGGTGVTKVAYSSGGTGSFSQSVGSLTSGTLYYMNAYATNSAGTSYGTTTSFTTSSAYLHLTGSEFTAGDNIAAFNKTYSSTSFTFTPATSNYTDYYPNGSFSGLYSLDNNSTGGSGTQITITAPGYSFDLNKFSCFADGAYSVAVTVTYIGGSTTTNNYTTTANTVNIFSPMQNDVVSVKLVTSGYATFNDFDITDIKLLPVGPTVSSVAVSPNGTYRGGDILNFTVTYNAAVNVDITGGRPYIPITLNTGGTVNAIYVSGSGTTSLLFRYQIASGNLDADGISVGTAITANGGTLKSSGGVDANLTLNSVASTTGVLIDAVAPWVSSVSSTTANGIYKLGDVIAITISFSEVVTVTGTPTLTLNSGGTASYSSGSGSTILTFSYTVGSGQSSSDLDYSNAFGSLQLSGGTISDAAGNWTILNLPTVGGASSLGGQKNIIIGIAPTVTTQAVSSIAATTATGNGNITALGIPNPTAYGVCWNTTGTPTIANSKVDKGATSANGAFTASMTGLTASTTYHVRAFATNSVSTSYGEEQDFTTSAAGVLLSTSPTLTFTSNPTAITADDIASDGEGGSQAISDIDIQVFNISDTNGTLLSALSWQNNGFLASNNGAYSGLTNENNAGSKGMDIKSADGSEFRLKQFVYYNWGETSTLTNTVKGYRNGSEVASTTFEGWDSGYNPITVVLDATFGNVDEVRFYISAGGYMGDQSASNHSINSIQVTSPVVSSSATVSSVAVSPNGTSRSGNNLNLTVTYNEAVSVVTTGGTPYIPITLNIGGTVNASYVSGSGTTALVFRYTVASGNADNDGISVGTAITANGGTLKSAGGVDANLTLNNVASTTGVKVDGIAPTITSVNSSTANGIYKVGDVISIQVNFSEMVNLTGWPQLILETGTTDRYVQVSGGATTSTLTFNYTVAAGDFSADLDCQSTTALQGGNIYDAVGNAAIRTLPVPGTANSLSSNKAIVIDGVAPTVGIVLTDNTLKVGETSLVTFTFSEAVTGFTNADLSIANGTLTAVSSSDGGVTWTATFTPTTSVTDATNVITLDNTGVTDAAGNAGSGTTDSNNYVIDTLLPTIPDVTSSTADGTYKLNDVITITITFSESVTVTGTPTLTLNSGGTASYSSGSGSTVLTFSYTLGSGESSADLDYSATNSLALAGGTIKDIAGNDATLTLPTVGGANSLGGQKNIVIAINPSSGGTIATDQSGCYPFNPVEITSSLLPTGHIGTLEYKWQSSTTGASSGFGDIGSTNSATYTPGTLTATTWYKRLARVNCMSDWTGAVESNVVQITVRPIFSAGAIATTNETICMNGNPGEIGSLDDGSSSCLSGSGSGDLPELMYFKFNSPGNQENSGSSPVGTNPATLNGLTIGSTGESGTALVGNGLSSSSNQLNTGWTLDLPSTGWTISFWLNNFPQTSSTTYYYFGETSTSFRCFTGGVAGNGNLIVRGTGLTDVPISSIPSSATVIHLVYTGSSIKVYKNGVLSGTVAQSSVNIKGSGSFTIGGYSTSNSMSNGVLLDEFRLYNRALDETEITTTWNSEISGASTVAYQWQKSTTDANSGFSDIVGANSAKYDPPTGLTNTTWYRRQVKDNCCNTSFSNSNGTWKVTVNSPSEPTAGTNSYSYDGTLKTASANVAVGETIDWYTDATGGTSTTAPSGTNVGTYSAYAETRNTTTGCVSANRTLITLEITKATLTVTADAQTKIYGEANPLLTFQYSGWKNGDDAEDLTTKPTAATTVTVTSPVNVYTNNITVSGGVDENYSFSYVPANFTVTKATLTVTADAQTKIYGEANPLLTFQYSGWKNGDDAEDLTTKPTAATTVTATSPVDVYTNNITVSGGVDENYSFSYVPANFTVTKATLTVTADAQTKIYGEANPLLTFQYSGWKNSDDAEDLTTKPTAATTVTATSPVDVYTNNITVSGGADENYSFSYVPANFTVTKATLTVTADAKTKIYGEANPLLTFQYSGWKNGDDAEDLTTKPTAATTVTATSPVDVYTNNITVSGGVDENYSFSYVPANFTVTKATLTVTADAQTKIYGEANPLLTFQYSGWMNGDTETVLDTKPTVTTTVNLTTAVGIHTGAITVSGGVDKNYDFTYVAANFTVTKAMLTVIADPQAKLYGTINRTLTFVYSGWVNGENESVLTTKPRIFTAIDETSPVAVYVNAITISGGVDENYDFTYVPSNFNVIKATLIVTADPQTKMYGEPNPLLTFTYSGWMNGDNAAMLTTAPIAGTNVTITSPVAVYANDINLSGGMDENYTFRYVPANFEVTKARQAIVFGALSPKTYGDAPFNLVATTNSKLAVSFTSSNTNVATVSGNTVTIVGVGTTIIKASQAGNNNYMATEAAQKLTVNNKVLTVTAAIAKSKTYDGNAIADITGASLSGVIGTDDVTLENTATGTFSQANVGSGLSVSSAMTISGANAGNYILLQPAGLKADITKKEITVTAQSISKECNQPDQALTYSFSPDLISGDSFSGLLSREAGNVAGDYQILQGSLLLSKNYRLIYQGATFSIVDNAPFWITAETALDTTLEYNDVAGLAAAQALAPVAYDVCDNERSKPIKVSGQFVKSQVCDLTGSYTNTWTVKDSKGNISSVYKQVITLVDRTSPFVKELPSIQFLVAPGVCETAITYPEFTIYDACLDTVELISGLGKSGLFPLGTTMERWKVTDKSGNSAFIYFAVTVKTYNLPPSIDQVKDLVVAKNTNEVEVPLSGIDPTSGCSSQEIVSVIANTDNSTLVPEILVDYSNGKPTGKLTLKIAENMEGEATIWVKVKDNGGTENGGSDTRIMTFVVKVDGTKTDVQDLDQNFNAKVYPNPSSGRVNIEVTGSANSTVRIFNAVGVEVFKRIKSVDFPINIDLSNNISGMYLVEISNGKQTILKKLVLKK